MQISFYIWHVWLQDYEKNPRCVGIIIIPVTSEIFQGAAHLNSSSRETDLQHAMLVSLHFLDGIHKFDEPVSKTTLKDCGGVPMVITP
jgi:hypothetical protein